MDDALQNTWWGGTSTAYIHRMADRILMGAAVLNDGDYPFTELDWWGGLSTEIVNGVTVANGNDVNYAQVAVLADHEAPPASMAVPQIAILGAIQSRNGVTGSTPRAGEFIAWNNCETEGEFTAAWAIYTEAHRITENTANTYGHEIAVRALVPTATGWNPYSTPGAGLIGLEIQAGAGLPSTGQYPATAAQYIQANPMPFGAGIIFLDGAIGPYGLGGSKPAMMLPFDHSIQWFKDATTVSGQLRGDQYGNMFFDNNSGGMWVINAAVSRGLPATKTASSSLVGVKENSIICNGSASMTLTLPSASAAPGREIDIKNIANFSVTSASANVVPLIGGSPTTALLPATKGKWVELISDGSNWVIKAGN